MIALIFDTETTGFKHGDFIPEIVQIGAVLQDIESRRVLAELNVICKPLNPIPAEVSAIHGITDDLAERYGVAQDKAGDMFADIVRMADVVVAHNLSFDLGIVRDRWPAAHEALMAKDQFCTMVESTAIVGIQKTHGGGNKFPKLVEAYAYFHDGATFDNAHDAMADVRACRDVFFALTKRLAIPNEA